MLRVILVLVIFFILFWAIIARTQMIIDRFDDMETPVSQCKLLITEGESSD